MADGILVQERISPNPPPHWSEKDKIERLLRFTFVNKYMRFYYERVGSDNADLNFYVKKDSLIIISLSNDVRWRWSQKLEAITTKFDYCMLYGDLQYDRQGNFIDRPVGDTFEYKRIQFKARANRYATGTNHHQDDSHGFSLNLDLLMADGTVLPITLDPDIKNPPPDTPFLNDGTLFAY